MVAVKARPLRGEGLSSFVKAAAHANHTSRWIHSKIREHSFLTKGGSYINETKWGTKLTIALVRKLICIFLADFTSRL